MSNSDFCMELERRGPVMSVEYDIAGGLAKCGEQKQNINKQKNL